MSLYKHVIVRADGDLQAVIWIQNEYTGNTVKQIRSIQETAGQYYVRADGRKHNITHTVTAFKEHEETVKKALDFYKRNNGRLYG